jgi:CheY-like chemotaxis protein
VAETFKVKGLKALIAEDDDDIRELLHLDLARLVDDIHTVDTGDKAIEYLKSKPVDLCLLDVNMPGATGLEVLEHFPLNQPRPIFVMVTGTCDFEITRTALQRGAFDYLQKPFTRIEFTSTMQKALTYLRYRSLSDLLLQQILESFTHTSIKDFLKLTFGEREEILKTLPILMKQKFAELEQSKQALPKSG